jgi:hypothetical protein
MGIPIHQQTALLLFQTELVDGYDFSKGLGNNLALFKFLTNSDGESGGSQ